MKNRTSNIELLRIVLMVMIVIHHVIVHGFGLENSIKNVDHVKTTVYSELFVNCFVIVGVNTFVFISGYFSIKFKVRSLASFILQAFFYSVCITVFFLLIGSSLSSSKDIIKSILPISGNVWWFLGVYLALYFISPILNMGVEYLDNRQLVIIIAGLLYLDCFSGFIFKTISADGFTIFHFITIYLLARAFNKFNITIKKPVFLFVGFSIILFFSVLIFLDIKEPKMVWRLFAFNNPILVLSAIMLFYSFKGITIQSNTINVISSAVLGIYLIHDHPLSRKAIAFFINKAKADSSIYLMALNMMIIVIVIFTAGTLIELARKYIFYRIEHRMLQFWQENTWVGKNKEHLRTQIGSMGISK